MTIVEIRTQLQCKFTSFGQEPPPLLGIKLNEQLLKMEPKANPKTVWIPGPLIVGAGPSGLATASCLKEKGVPSLILEKENCIASSWKLRTYERLKLHLPKQFCELPLMAFPWDFPTYPTKQQFISYLDAYTERFSIEPLFGMGVRCAEYDPSIGFWRVKANDWEFICRWLIVATGENSEAILPDINGISDFRGRVLHTSSYKKGDDFKGEKVLVVGCGNSGMEVCLDLCDNDVEASMVVRDKLHILPREILGISTFGLSMWLLKWLPIKLVDGFLLLCAWFILGSTEKYGLRRPKIGPLQFKNATGKTPVLDVGALSEIKSGRIKVFPSINRFMEKGVELVDGRQEEFDSVILATGYKSNVPSWLKVWALHWGQIVKKSSSFNSDGDLSGKPTNIDVSLLRKDEEFFSKLDGLPKNPFPNSWKGKNGLYATGYTKRGLLGASMDARRIADDIARQWNSMDARRIADDIARQWNSKTKHLPL